MYDANLCAITKKDQLTLNKKYSYNETQIYLQSLIFYKFSICNSAYSSLLRSNKGGK